MESRIGRVLLLALALVGNRACAGDEPAGREKKVLLELVTSQG